MNIRAEKLEYVADGDTFEGVIAFDAASDERLPGILVFHTWAGQGDFEAHKCEALAGLGYVALAADVYGKGRRGGSREDNEKLLAPMLADRGMLLSRLAAAHDALKAHPRVDATRTAAIGFCFGGLCALDLARSGAAIDGVVSFHGLLGRPEALPSGPIGARVLVLHGWDDPMATPEAVLELAAELSGAGCDWQLHAYGGTVHAFTNPNASDAALGTVYDPDADRRSWQAMRQFLTELFG